MNASIRPSRLLFAAALIGLAILGFAYGNSTATPEVPTSLPGRPAVIFICSLIELASGIGLLLRPLVTPACRLVLLYLLLWLALLKVPVVMHAPTTMVSWESFAEIAAVTGGAWCLFAAHAGSWEATQFRRAVGASGIRIARSFLIVALVLFGLAHFAYAQFTASLVPRWLGFPLVWVYLTGSAYIAGAAAMLCGIRPRLAACLEAAMIWSFTLLVWLPRVAPLPQDQQIWSEFLISWLIGAAAWLVADTYREAPPTAPTPT